MSDKNALSRALADLEYEVRELEADNGELRALVENLKEDFQRLRFEYDSLEDEHNELTKDFEKQGRILAWEIRKSSRWEEQAGD